ncbi:hypothetical protein [Fluviispira multicolorata]|uniref:J domain-containing protein n=1 Tax=Fluviispira multicolorata TaxID=2654512 RepID=A0A833JE17_9BACT|nr:hypothetical protein [Fluviispira multicolorata]KAB8029170.1 hypothetical protein GCL57_11580 [Fluviispira multicolorata]
MNLISYEDLMFSFKEEDLYQEFSVHHETFALRSAKVIKISDADLLRKILPEDLSSQMFGSGHLNLLAFIFALRHKILALNSLFHLAALKQNKDPYFHQTKSEFRKVFGGSFIDDFEHIFEMLLPPFWGNTKRLPILGFSAVGCHFVLRDINSCRAFDAYNIPYCKNRAEGTFCHYHMQEKFWIKNITEEASVQAKLSQFYVDPSNFSQFDEEILVKLVNSFFAHFKAFHATKHIPFISHERVQFLLKFYSFSGLEDLKEKGTVELRKRFLEKAKQYHPDVGGAHDSFREARENYEYLREILAR